MFAKATNHCGALKDKNRISSKILVSYPTQWRKKSLLIYLATMKMIRKQHIIISNSRPYFQLKKIDWVSIMKNWPLRNLIKLFEVPAFMITSTKISRVTPTINPLSFSTILTTKFINDLNNVLSLKKLHSNISTINIIIRLELKI